MLIQSKVSDEKYIWIRIPRTASKTYGKVFFPDGNYEHRHNNYYHETYTHGEISAFSVVRHPYTRFVSSVKYMVKQQNLRGKVDRFNFTLPCENTEVLCQFFNDNLEKLQDCFSSTAYQEVFKTDDLGFVRLFFIPQHHYAGFPLVKIFKYESLNEFNSWIETTLGYDTSKIEVFNSSADELRHINFEDPTLIEIIQRLFEADYKFFGYV